MQVREGYKQTEVGVIPKDWEVETLGSLVQITSGESPSLFRFETSGIPYFKVDQLNNDSKFLSTTPYFFRKGKTVTRGSVIFPKRGASILLNKVRILESDSYMDTNLMTLTPVELLDSEYLYYTLIYLGLWRFADTTSIPQINNKHVVPLVISLPAPAEQRAIATALSDVDALLAAQDKLIAKKRDVKQAAMQQLLTGKQRLPGFNGEWEVKLLGDIAEIVMGQSPSSSNYNVKGLGLPLIQGNADIADRKTIRRIFTTEITKRGKCGDILMSVRAPVGEISLAVFDVCLGRGVCAIRYTNDYLYHYLISQEPGWARLSKGSTFDSVNSADVKALEVCLPTDADEQIAIASILADMDADLTALEQQRDKTRAIKQGMMQELLTGRTRLV